MSENPPVKVALLESATDIEHIRPHWLRLAGEADPCHPFSTYTWYRAWREVFGQGKGHRVLACWSPERLLAVHPMMQNRVWRGPALSAQYDYAPEDVQFLRQKPRFRCVPLQQLSSPINLESANFRGGMMSVPGMESACQQAWLGAVAKMPDWDLLRLPCTREQIAPLLAQASALGLHGFARKHSMPIYAMQIMPWQELLASRSRNFRKQVGRAQEKAAALAGGYQHRAFVGAAEMPQGLAQLYALAEKSWKSEGRSEEALHLPPSARNRAFFEQLCMGPDSEFTPYIQLLYDGAKPFCGALTLLIRDRVFGALTFFDPTYAALYPGRLLFSEMIERAWQLGGRSFDLNGGSPFMAYFSDSATHYHQVLLFNRHPYARGLHWMACRFSKDRN